MNLMTRQLWRSLAGHGGLHFVTLIVLTGTFFVISLFELTHENLGRVLTQWGDSIQLEVFLNDAAKESELKAVHDFLKAQGNVRDLAFVSSQMAADEFRSRLGHSTPRLMADPEFQNILPASFRIRMNDSVQNAADLGGLKSLAQSLQGLPGVEDVSYGQGWVENYATFVGVIQSGGWALVILLLAGGLLVVSHAIRSSIEQRRDEIEVLELIGATSRMIRLPYYLEGSILGFLASSIGLILLYIFYFAQRHWLPGDLNFLNLSESLRFLSVWSVIRLLGLGTFFGLMGAYLSVNRLATGWLASEGGR